MVTERDSVFVISTRNRTYDLETSISPPPNLSCLQPSTPEVIPACKCWYEAVSRYRLFSLGMDGSFRSRLIIAASNCIGTDRI